MRNRFVFIGAGIVLLLSAFVLYAADTYVPTADEVLYGTWTNKDMYPQKTVISVGTVTQFDPFFPDIVFMGGSEKILNKWTDSDGNVWYQVDVTYNVGVAHMLPAMQVTYHEELWKISRSGTVAEYNWVDVNSPDFDPQYFPKKIEPGQSNYYIYDRAKD